MEKKQTALEWFAYNDAQATLDYAEGRSTELVFAVQKMAILQQALEMERQQIIKTARVCHFEGVRQSAKTSEDYIAYGEQYYNETYGKDVPNDGSRMVGRKIQLCYLDAKP